MLEVLYDLSLSDRSAAGLAHVELRKAMLKKKKKFSRSTNPAEEEEPNSGGARGGLGAIVLANLEELRS